MRDLLSPYAPRLSDLQLAQLSQYLDLLLKWNARINLTAIRAPEDIVTRHFGESLFAAAHLVNPGQSDLVIPSEREHPRARVEGSVPANDQRLTANDRVLDLGSGAGFPGLPLKLCAPELRVTLIESRHKKAAFLREVIRALQLTGIEVVAQRAETLHLQAGLVTLRAVERFADTLPVAASLVAPAGRLALLIGADQSETAARLLPGFAPAPPIPIPHSRRRILQVFHHP